MSEKNISPTEYVNCNNISMVYPQFSSLHSFLINIFCGKGVVSVQEFWGSKEVTSSPLLYLYIQAAVIGIIHKITNISYLYA